MLKNAGVIFPARVGMNPWALRIPDLESDFPRASGDEPQFAELPQLIRDIFPARVGMNPSGASA